MKRLLILILFLSIGWGQILDINLLDHNSYVKTGNQELLTDYLGKIDSAITDIGATKTTLFINTQPDSIDANLTSPSTLDLVWERGYPLIAETSSDTFFINGGLTAGNYAIFDTSLYVAGVPKINKFNLMWYGALGDSTQDDTRYIQKVFDMVAQNPKVSSTIFAPVGVYNFTQVSLGDSTQSLTDKGKIILTGVRATDSANYPFTNKIGTVFNSTKTSGNCFIVNNEETPSNNTERAQNIVLKDFSVIGNTSGKLFVMQSVSDEAIIENVTVINKGSGIAAYMFNAWQGMFKNFQVRGGGKSVSDVAFWYDIEDGSGSMISFDNCTFMQANVALRLGANPTTHSGVVQEGGLGNNTLFRSIQMKNSNIGLQLYAGAQMNLVGGHFEGNDSVNVELRHGSVFNVKDTYFGRGGGGSYLGRQIDIMPNKVTLTNLNTTRLFIENSRMFKGDLRTIFVRDSARTVIEINKLYNNLTASDTLIWFQDEFFGTVEIRNLIDNSQNAQNPLSNKPEWVLLSGTVNRRSDLLNTDTLDFQNTNWMPRSLYVTGVDDTCTIFFPGHADDSQIEQNWATTITPKDVTNPIYIDVTAGGETNNRISKTGTDGVTFLAARDTLTTNYIPRTYMPIVIDNRVIWNAY